MDKNYPLWYSEKEDKLIYLKEELEITTGELYFIKPLITIFTFKPSNPSKKELININVDYTYKKRVN